MVRIVKGTCGTGDSGCLRVLVLGAGITSRVMWGQCAVRLIGWGIVRGAIVNAQGGICVLCVHGHYFFN